MKAEDKAKANLKRTTKQTVKKMLAAVKQATKDVEALIAEHVRQNPYGWMDAGRESTYAAIDAHFKSLRKSLDGAIGGLVRASASTGSLLAEAQSKGAVVRFSEEHLQAYLERVTPKNAPSLAAVYTASMSASVKAALRETAINVFTQGAAAGLTMHEQARQFQAEWSLRAKDRNPYRFVDKRGRAWENARYIQMLTRTTAQRVETAAFCDSMLSSGFPIARISNDSGNDCGICAQWEGRLIDLSAGHQLGSGTYTLQEAREAGLFHPNCTHRLEYVSVAEIPDALWEKVKDKIGKPGAFGDNKTATKPDLPTKKQAQEHIKQVETAAEEKAKELQKGTTDTPIQVNVLKSLEDKNVTISSSLDSLDHALIMKNLAHLNSLLDRYPKVARTIKDNDLTIDSREWNRDVYGALTPSISTPRMTLCLSARYYAHPDDLSRGVARNTANGTWTPCAKENRAVFSLTHEFGHVVQNVLMWEHINANKANRMEYEDAVKQDRAAYNQRKRPTAIKKYRDKIAKEHKKELMRIMKEINPQMTKDEKKAAMSRYGHSDAQEYFAEAFATAICGEPSIIGQAMNIFLERSVK